MPANTTNNRHRWKVHRLILMVEDRRRQLQRGDQDHRRLEWELKALTWVLDVAGWPPSRYEEVLTKHQCPESKREESS